MTHRLMPILKLPKFTELISLGSREHQVSARWSDEATKPLHVRFLEAAQLRGVEISQNSRYRAYLKILEDRSSELDHRITAYHEIYQILTALEKIDNIEAWRDTIDVAITYDPKIPLNTQAQSRGRDAQFELYVAGCLQAAGMGANRGEPDIISNRGRFVFTVAAKRLKSERQIVARAREARDQIEKARKPGIIALDLTPLQPTYYSRYPVDSHLTIPSRPLEYMDRIFEPLIPEIEKRCSSKRVMGIVAFAVVGAASTNGHTVMLMPIHRGHRLCPLGSEKANQMWEIVESLGSSTGLSF